MTGYDVAKSHLGLHEVKDRRELMKFMSAHGMVIDPSTTPWCAAFIGACERKAGKLGTGKYNARSYLTYGTPVKLKDAVKGDIVVFSRGGSSWQGHVTYFDGMDQDSEGNTLLRVLGGNQRDSVCVSYYPLTRLLGIRRS